jgi:hypothetical protein
MVCAQRAQSSFYLTPHFNEKLITFMFSLKGNKILWFGKENIKITCDKKSLRSSTVAVTVQGRDLLAR